MKNITEEQIAQCKRHHEHGKTFYTVPSATTESVYTVRFQGYTPIDNCPRGLSGLSDCWHCKAVCIAESRYQAMIKEERMNEAKLAAQRELAACKKFGFQAYQSNAFSLLK
jgi:hypothetical protein